MQLSSKTSNVRQIQEVDIPSTCKTPEGKTPAGKTPGKTVMPTTVTPTLVTSAVLTPKALMPALVMPTAVTPTKASAEEEVRAIAEAEASAAPTKAALEVRQIHYVGIPPTFTTSKVRLILDVDIFYIRQKYL